VNCAVALPVHPGEAVCDPRRQGAAAVAGEKEDMSLDPKRTRPNRTWSPGVLGAVVVAPALVVAACGGTSSSTSSQGGGSSASPAAAGSGTTTVETHRGPLGTFLTDGSGRTLYLFEADHGSRPTCTGPCATAWPPFTAQGPVRAGGQVRAGMVATAHEADGAQQVTYAGHPLYFFAGDQGAGQTTGQGSTGFGALWWVVSPTGRAITDAPGGSSSGYGSSGYGSGGR
jgi:predicted lipoprotein with Yx(FWY)xxD motif